MKGQVKQMLVRRGDVYWADLSGARGSEQGGRRPVLVLQNDKGNMYSPTTQVAPITSRDKKYMPTHFDLSNCNCGLPKDSIALVEQIRTIDKCRLEEKIGHIDKLNLIRINLIIMLSFDLISWFDFKNRNNKKSKVA